MAISYWVCKTHKVAVIGACPYCQDWQDFERSVFRLVSKAWHERRAK